MIYFYCLMEVIIMANINDYLRWRGDIKFSKRYPFNELDSVILARFSYLLFHKIKMNKDETIESISNKMKDFDNSMFLYNGDKEMITLLGECARFKDLKVSDYVRVNSKEEVKQFGAICIHLPYRELYVSYIGTDSTIYGWKEDFYMSFMDDVPCRELGANYLSDISRKYWYKKLRVGGHSKGGNVAIYSALTNSYRVQKRIIKVYNYDGPGLSKQMYDRYNNKNIVKKMETYIPQDSIVGTIFHHEEKVSVVESKEYFLLEHDIFSWQVLRDDLIRCDGKVSRSLKLESAIRDYLDSTTKEERKIVIDALFEIIEEAKIENVYDLIKNYPKLIPKALLKYKNFSKEERVRLTGLLSAIISASVRNYVKK